MWVLRGPDEQAKLGQHQDPVVSLGNRSRVGEGKTAIALLCSGQWDRRDYNWGKKESEICLHLPWFPCLI